MFLNDRRPWDRPRIGGIVGFGAGVVLGGLADKAYLVLPNWRKEEWRRVRALHHDEVGMLIASMGNACRSSFWTFFGLGLVASSEFADADKMST